MQSSTAATRTSERLIRRSEVERLTGLSRSNIYNRNLHDPDWPKPVQLGPNTVAWVESEVVDWVHDRIAGSRASRSQDGRQ